jgi:hypothetical protein
MYEFVGHDNLSNNYIIHDKMKRYLFRKWSEMGNLRSFILQFANRELAVFFEIVFE